jgi:hypothetical protein
MYKHLSCAAFKIKLTTGSGNAGTCEKLHDRRRIRLRQKAGVCASALNPCVHRQRLDHFTRHNYKVKSREICSACSIVRPKIIFHFIQFASFNFSSNNNISYLIQLLYYHFTTLSHPQLRPLSYRGKRLSILD